jgi:ureidoacrylate peracid hydrolase
LQGNKSQEIVYGEDSRAITVMIKGYQLKPILMVIDVQDGFVSKGGSYDKLGIDTSPYQEVLPNISKLVNKCKRIGMPILFTQSIRESSGVVY